MNNTDQSKPVTIDDLAILVHQANIERRAIATLKDELMNKIWHAQPTKHKALYDEYEPNIKRHSYRLVDIEKQIKTAHQYGVGE